MMTTISKRIALLLVLALACFAQQASNLATLPDITGTGAAVPLSGSHLYAHWIQITTPSTNSATVQWGDSNVSTSRGSIIAAGGGQFIPASGPVYDLSTIYVYIGSGDKVKVTYQTY